MKAQHIIIILGIGEKSSGWFLVMMEVSYFLPTLLFPSIFPDPKCLLLAVDVTMLRLLRE
jgi:hypothetical protein